MEKVYIVTLESIENGASEFEILKVARTLESAEKVFNEKKVELKAKGLEVSEEWEGFYYCGDRSLCEEYRIRIEENEITQ